MRWPLEQIRPMQLTGGDFNYLGLCLEGFFFGTICIPEPSVPLLRHFNISPVPGLYSGIFAMYLQYHLWKKDTDQAKPKTILFYTLCALYVLSLATFSLDTTAAMVVFLRRAVSNNSESKTMIVFSVIIRR